MGMTLTPLDLFVLGIPLIAVLAVTISLRRYMRTVADFLAASRCAGRYLICTSMSETGAAVMAMVTSLEIYSRTGVSMGLWNTLTSVVFFVFTLFGIMTYRFRETRCLTFHQFFELRYSKGLRVFASFLNIASGLINFGLVPAVGARFFVYLCGLPETVHMAGLGVPTFVILMFAFMAMSMFMTVTGGQISVMVTDCAEALISGIFYLIVAFYVVSIISPERMKDVLLSGKPGNSYVNPFDISDRPDFNAWYIILSLVFNLIIFRGSAWSQGFNAAAKTAHEGRMAGILSSWRGYGAGAMGGLIAIGAFTLLHHPAFAAQQKLVQQGLQGISNPQLQTQMAMPLALNILLVPGIKGAFCAIGLFGLLASQGLQLHNYGSTLLQDVILPLRKKPFTPRGHLLALQLTLGGIGLFVCIFSWLYKPVDYLTMMVTLIGAIYLGGVGAVVWGGLYWKKGTTAGAWASIVTGTTLAIGFNIVQQFWTYIQPVLLTCAGHGRAASFLAFHTTRCPFNGVQFATVTAVSSFVIYIVVSLLTCRENFDMEKMLHRGRYAVVSEQEAGVRRRKMSLWSRFIGIDEHFSKGDKILSIATSLWVFAWNAIALGILLWWFFFGKLSDEWWFNYFMIAGIKIPLVLAVVTTIWFTIGTVRDIIDLFKTLRTTARNAADDGTVRDHQNLDDTISGPEPAVSPADVKPFGPEEKFSTNIPETQTTL